MLAHLHRLTTSLTYEAKCPNYASTLSLASPCLKFMRALVLCSIQFSIVSEGIPSGSLWNPLANCCPLKRSAAKLCMSHA